MRGHPELQYLILNAASEHPIAHPVSAQEREGLTADAMWPGDYAITGPDFGADLSKASINVRLSVQHKCHFVMPPQYQMFEQ